jgi:hypothetical protein
MVERDPLPTNPFDADDGCDLDTLLHPSQAFDRPSDVVNDPDLSLDEKRAILASWASDACAVEAAPALRRRPGGKGLVRFDEVMEALRALDQQARDEAAGPICAGLGSGKVPSPLMRERDFRSAEGMQRAAGQ